jgi:hypothetical protein
MDDSFITGEETKWRVWFKLIHSLWDQLWSATTKQYTFFYLEEI